MYRNSRVDPVPSTHAEQQDLCPGPRRRVWRYDADVVNRVTLATLLDLDDALTSSGLDDDGSGQ